MSEASILKRGRSHYSSHRTMFRVNSKIRSWKNSENSWLCSRLCSRDGTKNITSIIPRSRVIAFSSNLAFCIILSNTADIRVITRLLSMIEQCSWRHLKGKASHFKANVVAFLVPSLLYPWTTTKSFQKFSEFFHDLILELTRNIVRWNE